MEKRKPHYDLKKFKKLFSGPKSRVITRAAQKGAASIGYMDMDDIQTVLKKLGPEHFYKSMTTHLNHKLWQDVYKYRDDDNGLYIKLQLSLDGKEAVLVQMKKDEGDDE
jgi:motility quorum-sensing regulator/GCU-specific mRNA interferase toxin